MTGNQRVNAADVSATTHQQHGTSTPSNCVQPSQPATALQRLDALATMQMISAIEMGEEEEIPFHINCLPTELLTKIMLHLPYEQRIRAERVCRLWSHISWSHSCWTDLHQLKVLRGEENKHKRIHSVLERVGPYLHKFWLWMEFGWEWNYYYYYPLLFESLASLSPNLQHFALFNKTIEMAPWRGALLCQIGDSIAEKLISLAISYEHNLQTDTTARDCLHGLIQKCSRLENLYISVRNFPFDEPSDLLLPCTLKYLSIGPAIDNTGIAQLLASAARDCPDLGALHLTSEPNEEAVELVAKFKKLECLHIDGSLLRHSFRFDMLQYLSIKYIYEEPFRLICRQCPHLKLFKFIFVPTHLNKLEPLWEMTNLRHLLNVDMAYTQVQQLDRTYKVVDDEDRENFRNILKTIAAYGNLEVLITPIFGPVEYVVNSLIRPCKSFLLLQYRDLNLEEANKFCALINQLVVVEESQMVMDSRSDADNDETKDKRRRRNFPIHIVVYNKLPCETFPCSEFVQWHALADTKKANEIVNQYIHKIIKLAPRFMFNKYSSIFSHKNTLSLM